MGPDVPDRDHIVRYAKPSLIEDDEVDGSAFLLRPDELGLSVNWLEAFGVDDQCLQLSEVRRLCRLRLSPNGQFAKLNVGQTKRYVEEEAGAIGIMSVPLDATDEFEADPSHAEIIDLPVCESDQAMLVGDLIAKCVMYPLYPVRA